MWTNVISFTFCINKKYFNYLLFKKRSKTAQTENGNSSYFVIVNSSLVYKKGKNI